MPNILFMTHLTQIVSQFDICGKVLDISPLGNGLINDTYKVKTDGADDYVLQRINNAIFKDVDLLQRNLELVTAHIRAKLSGDKDVDRKVLRFMPLKDGSKTYYQSADGKFWRLSVFIKDALTFEAVTPEFAYYAGEAFGRFEAMLADIPEELGETIPDFHNMELRARQLEEAEAADAAGRMADPCVKDLLARIHPWKEEMCKAEALHRAGKLPKRVCHCDTKVNNILFDADGSILCVIDLDTVMPSYVFSDFGDFLRTGAATAPEDEPDLDKMGFNMEIFKSFAKGYLKEATFLTPVEKENLPYAVQLFPYMQAVRFLADYINGDTYYKIKYPEHNLVRTAAQMKLFDCVTAALPDIKRFVDNN